MARSPRIPKTINGVELTQHAFLEAICEEFKRHGGKARAPDIAKGWNDAHWSERAHLLLLSKTLDNMSKRGTLTRLEHGVYGLTGHYDRHGVHVFDQMSRSVVEALRDNGGFADFATIRRAHDLDATEGGTQLLHKTINWMFERGMIRTDYASVVGRTRPGEPPPDYYNLPSEALAGVVLSGRTRRMMIFQAYRTAFESQAGDADEAASTGLAEFETCERLCDRAFHLTGRMIHAFVDAVGLTTADLVVDGGLERALRAMTEGGAHHQGHRGISEARAAVRAQWAETGEEVRRLKARNVASGAIAQQREAALAEFEAFVPRQLLIDLFGPSDGEFDPATGEPTYSTGFRETYALVTPAVFVELARILGLDAARLSRGEIERLPTREGDERRRLNARGLVGRWREAG